MKRIIVCVAVVLAAGCQTASRPADPALALPTLFSDGMVLQQGRPVAVWGSAKAGTPVTVAFGKARARTLANEQGIWQAYIGPLNANATSQDLVIRAGSAKRVVHNVLVGEVWLCSGQSNMEMTMQPGPLAVNNVEQELSAANYPTIRLFNVPRVTKFTPQTDLPSATWDPCSAETVRNFSAAGYFFGRELSKELNVPIGLINASYGASPAEAWVSEDGLRAINEWRPVMDLLPKLIADSAKRAGEYKKDYDDWFIQLDSFDLGYTDGKPAWADPAFDAHDWPSIPAPGYWEDKGYANLDGFGWYRKEIDLPATWATKPLHLHLTGINDMDRTFFNGEMVGSFEGTAGSSTPRNYAVPAKLVHPGRNVIAVRVYDIGNNGGFMGAASDMHLDLDGGTPADAISLAGPWQFKPGMDTTQVPAKPVAPVYVEGNQHIPAVLSNAMIAPLIPYGLRGVIWYQGESNTGRAKQYETLFPSLINDWRARFRQGDLPFYFVQLASFGASTQDPNLPSQFAELREAQTIALTAPNTGMAVTIDIGDANNIHPRNKQDVGKRLALQALKQVYKKEVDADGPRLVSTSVKGSVVELTFEYAAGLRTRDNAAPRGFAVAGADEIFHWASAKIEGNRIALTCDQVAAPAHVRYAWADNPDANVCNAAGLPAAPFRASLDAK